MQILFRSKTCQLCVVITHLVVDRLGDVLVSDGTDDLMVPIEYWDRILAVIDQLFHTIRRSLIRVHIRIGGTDNVLQLHVLTGSD